MKVNYPAVISGIAIPIVAASCFGARAPQSPEQINWRAAKPLTAETIGKPVGQIWVKLLDQVQVPGKNETIQLISYKMGTRLSETCHVASLNLTTGTLKTHPALGGQSVARTIPLGSKIYLGTSSPGHLAEYDPQTDTLVDLGNVFQKGSVVYSVAAGPDGTVAMGAGGSSEVALYSPSSRNIRRYGEVGRPDAGFTYYITQDSRFIYAVPRGNGMDLIAIDKATGARTTLFTTPAEGYINLPGGPIASITNNKSKGEPDRHYALRDGKLFPIAALPREHRSNTAPPFEVLIDKRNSGATGKVNILYRRAGQSGAAASWTSRPMTVGIETMPITRMIAVGPSQILGTTGPYGPTFLYDISRNSTRALGQPTAMNVYSMAQIDGQVYLSGYPSTEFAVADLNRAFTSDEGVGEGQGIPWTDPRANPRQIAYIGKILGGSHTGLGIFDGADGRIYVVAHRHRHYKGFGVAWYDPKTGKLGEIEDGGLLQQLQVSWVTPVEGGRKLAFSTRVQPDETKSAPPPKEAKVLLLDTSTGRFLPPLTPLPGAQTLGPVAEVSGGMLVGTAADNVSGPSTVYKLDLRTGRPVATRVYDGLICGVSMNGDVPLKSFDFTTGPDDKVWTVFRMPGAGAPSLIIKIRPSDLGVELLGTLGGDGTRFLFIGRDLYLTGLPELRRIRNAV